MLLINLFQKAKKGNDVVKHLKNISPINAGRNFTGHDEYFFYLALNTFRFDC
jgi:hypothetical protein